MFVSNTVQNILQNKRANTEIIVVLDGEWANPPIEQSDFVTVVYLSESIGQRAATNLAASIASGTWFMKVDAHCAFDEGFDQKILDDIQYDWTMVPLMKNLHAFDWVCNDCQWRVDQGPTPDSGKCPKCGSKNIYRDILWKPRKSPNSTSYRVNPDLEFKYFGEYKKKQKGDLVETMSLQGSCFVAHRDKYFGLKLCDDNWGSWGGQGAEVALKTWLSGGKVICTKKTWYAHMFRTQGRDFGFPYPNPGSGQKRAKDKLREIFLSNNWEHQVRPLCWLVEKFAPIPDWHDGDGNLKVSMTELSNEQLIKSSKPKKPKSRGCTNCGEKNSGKGILYYTDNKLSNKFALPVRKQLKKSGLPIVSASVEPLDFGTNVVVDREPGYMTMFMQILEGLYKLRELGANTVFFAEHDVLYHLTHFDFIPDKSGIFYYNQNVYKVHGEFGFALHYLCNQTSGLCANIDLLVDHYERRIKYINDNDPGDRKLYMKMIRRIGFEPGTHGRIPELKAKSKTWMSDYPNIDIRHNENLTPSRWRKDQFKNQRYTKGWTGLCDTVPGWGRTLGEFDELLKNI